MKKLVSLFFVIVFATAGCKNSKPALETLLGDGTPYYQYPEKMNGNVSKVVEKNYWAVPAGDAFSKGKALTKADRDTLGGWTPDYEATFDKDGNLASCTYLDENGKATSKYEITVDNNSQVIGKNYVNDSIVYYDKFNLDENGKRNGFIRYSPVVDTVSGKFEIKTNTPENTMEYNMITTKGISLYKIVLYFNDLKQFTHSEYIGKDGKLQLSYVVKYNEKGSASELTILDKDKKVSAVNYLTYEYDSKGNWVKAIVKDLKGIVVIEERTYTYFE
jgi:hypothetical protein